LCFALVAAAGAQDLAGAPCASRTDGTADAIQVRREAGTGGTAVGDSGQGDVLFPVNEGDTLDGAYRVESIGETQVTLTYLPLASEERIPVDSSLPVATAATRLDPAAAAGGGQQAASAMAARPAQLLWEGPQQVK